MSLTFDVVCASDKFQWTESWTTRYTIDQLFSNATITPHSWSARAFPSLPAQRTPPDSDSNLTHV